MAGDGGHADIEAVVLEEHEGASNRKAADVAAAEAAADDDMLGVLPLIELKESRGHRGQFASKLLDGRMYKPGGQRIVAFEVRIELRFGQLPGRRVAERVLAVLRNVLPPLIEDVSEGALIRTVAEKAVLVLEL